MTTSGDMMILRSVSSSMWPLIAPGDTVLVVHCERTRIRVGDIVVYLEDNRKIAHRIVGKKMIDGKEYLMQKGDMLLLKYGAISYDAVMGKVIAIEKKRFKVELKRPGWSVINFFLIAEAILEYRLASLLQFMVRSSPDAEKKQAEKEFIYYFYRIKNMIARPFFWLFDIFHSKK